MKINRNFFSLKEKPEFLKQNFECQLGRSLGLTRRCYLCEHYVPNIALLPDCKSSCKCNNFKTRSEVVKHLIERIFQFIDARERQDRDIFIVTIGYRVLGLQKQIFCEYLVPTTACPLHTEHKKNWRTFVKSFSDSTAMHGPPFSRLHNFPA